MRGLLVGLVMLLAACSSQGGGAVEVTAGTTGAGEPAATTAAAPVQTSQPARTSAPEVTVQSEKTFTMPKVTGRVLQDAQDELQARGSYLMDQEDATGQHRIQVLDSNWKVCTQIPRAGRKVPISTVVRLSAVKLDETCP